MKVIKKLIKKVSIITITIISAILAVGIGFAIYLTKCGEGVSVFIGNSDMAISILLSIVALIFSCITFFSIDAVKNKSRMDDNILECSNYTVQYSRIINDLNEETKEKFQEKLYSYVQCGKIHSCMEYADWLQNIIDHLVFFAYYDWKPGQKNEFLELIEKEKEEYKNLSSGIKYLLDENISLIKHVIKYQENRKLNKNQYSFIEDVRGKMLANPISKILFYNYLSIDYKNEVSKFMRRENDIKDFSVEFYGAWENNKITDEDDIKRCKLFLKMAKKNIVKAEKLAEEDLIWSGYIKYNKARICIMEFLMEDEEARNDMLIEITNIIDDCLENRENICFLFNNDGYLQKEFEKERIYAQELKNNFEKYFINKKHTC